MVQPMARMKKLGYCEVPIVKTDNDYVCFDWDSSDVEGDYEYVCPECERDLFPGIQDIQDYVDGQKTSLKRLLMNCFIDDYDKMRDFAILSKDDFLASYSYLTEEEYDATGKVVAELTELLESVLNNKFRNYLHGE
jgi:hypothetical protein